MEYLTEKRLLDFVNHTFMNVTILSNKYFQFDDKRYKPDIYIPELKLFIEFDGYRHFNQTQQILRDYYIINWCRINNYICINIPYFVQLDEYTIDYYFGDFGNYIDFSNVNQILEKYKYPHGFIDNKALLPSDFNYLGLKRFVNIFKNLPDKVKKDIFNSLKYKIEEYNDIEYVIPKIVFDELIDLI